MDHRKRRRPLFFLLIILVVVLSGCSSDAMTTTTAVQTPTTTAAPAGTTTTAAVPTTTTSSAAPATTTTTPTPTPAAPATSGTPTETPEPAPVFVCTNLKIDPTETAAGTMVTVTVIAKNKGAEAGFYDVVLEIDGQAVDQRNIRLDPGQEMTVAFQPAADTPGTHSVNVNGQRGSFTVFEAAAGTPGDWTIPTGTGTFYRAVHMGGNWGTNRLDVPRLPEEYFTYLRDLNVDWVGVSVALHVDGSMDSTVELDYREELQIPTFPDDALRALVQKFRQHGFNVYFHVAFESGAHSDMPVQRWQLGDPFAAQDDASIQPQNWPWALDHPQHDAFVAEFWQSYTACLVHIGALAEDEGVGMLTLGTETDRLFRSRSGGHWPNNFLPEMTAMVSAVRGVYTGLLGYEEHYGSIVNRDYFGAGSDYIHTDLGLDFIAVSAYFQLAPGPVNTPPTVAELETAWDDIFNRHLLPLQARNGGLPIVFTEFGYVDSPAALENALADEFMPKVFTDRDGNGLDDGEEVQANAYQALFNVMTWYPDVVKGAFLWDVMMATEEEYQSSFGQMRTFNIRDKLAEDVARNTYLAWR
jgi:hypothetical protein